VVAEQHLAHGTTVDEHDRRPLFSGLEILREEDLIVDLEAVRRLRDDQLRHDLRVHREAGRERIG
jgi:hypothetical protein